MDVTLHATLRPWIPSSSEISLMPISVALSPSAPSKFRSLHPHFELDARHGQTVR